MFAPAFLFGVVAIAFSRSRRPPLRTSRHKTGARKSGRRPLAPATARPGPLRRIHPAMTQHLQRRAEPRRPRFEIFLIRIFSVLQPIVAPSQTLFPTFLQTRPPSRIVGPRGHPIIDTLVSIIVAQPCRKPMLRHRRARPAPSIASKSAPGFRREKGPHRDPSPARCPVVSPTATAASTATA